MASPNQAASVTERKDWHLTDQDEAIILATARYNKIKKLEWQAHHGGHDYDTVELTEDERTTALEAANKSRAAKLYFDRIKIENRERRILEERALIAKWNYSHFYNTMKGEAHRHESALIFNDTTAPLIKAICFRLSNDSRYETELGYSFGKGLIIRGNPGLGKSWTIGLVADNPVCPVQIVTMNDITESVRTEGAFNGLKFASFSLVYIDDVGTEETPVKYYGTEIHWFKQLIEGIYAKDKMAMSRIIFSTNCSFDEMEAKYGFRVRDRLAETFDVLDLKGTSMRRK